MTTSKPIVILLVSIFVAAILATQQVFSQPISPNFEYAFCRNTLFGNYTANSTYEGNLKTVLSALVENSSTESFYNASAGSGRRAVYGQYYCRGDVSSQFCSNCIQMAVLHAFNCSNAKAAVIWFDECTLRYSNESLYGIPEISKTLSIYSLANMTDPAEFTAVLNDTVSSLILEAAHGNGSSLQPKYYATKEVTFSSSLKTAYFLAQCSPDLSEEDCESCLVSAFNKTQRCCGEWPLAIYSFPPSCQVMYNTRRIFYYTTGVPAANPPPPMFLNSPPPPPPSPTQVTLINSPPANTAPATGGSVMLRSSERSILLAFLMFVLRP